MVKILCAERAVKEKNSSTTDVLIIFIRLCFINSRKAIRNANVRKTLNTDTIFEAFKALNELLNVKVLEIVEKFFWNAKLFTKAVVTAVQKRRDKKL